MFYSRSDGKRRLHIFALHSDYETRGPFKTITYHFSHKIYILAERQKDVLRGWIRLIDFLIFHEEDNLFAFIHTHLLLKGVYSKWKEFAPNGEQILSI